MDGLGTQRLLKMSYSKNVKGARSMQRATAKSVTIIALRDFPAHDSSSFTCLCIAE